MIFAQQVTFKVKNVTVKTAVIKFKKTTGYSFVFGSGKVDTNKRISVNANNQPLRDVVAQILSGQNLDYEINGKFIIVKERQQIEQKAVNPQRINSNSSKIKATGRVTDENGEPIIGATVKVKGSSQGTITDLNGEFSINTLRGSILEISYIGYNSRNIRINGQINLSIVMRENSKNLEEVVVIGYGTQKKGDVSSAISSVKSDQFVKSPTPDAAQLIRGQVAGLAIVSPGADPTSTSEVSLRGITTLKSGTSPLVLIDGIPGDLITVSPDDIEQIDVLKDGSAAAIYGTRGTNGVILITTKNTRGEMLTQIDFNMYLSTQKITKKLDFFTADEYRQLVAQGKPGAIDDGATTDWLDEVTQSPLNQVYNISLKGGSRSTNYVAFFEYRDLNGIIKRSNNEMIYPRIDVTHRMFNNKLKINASVSGYQQKYFSGADGSSFNDQVYSNALTYNPTTPLKDAEGNWSESVSKTDYYNPVALLEETKGSNKATDLKMHAAIDFMPIEGLIIRWLVSSDIYNQTRGYYETSRNGYSIRNGRTGYASRGTTRSEEDVSELTAQYTRTIMNDHTFTLLAGYSYLKNNYENYYMQNYDFSSDDYEYNNMGNGAALPEGKGTEYSYQQENKLIGYFGRLNYNYKEKYMLSASIRHEGSTKFGENHKWGNFPAVSVAWNIKKENFLKNYNSISILKLRAGWGVTGTEPSSPYQSLNTLNLSRYAYYNGSWMKTNFLGSNANADLEWEKKAEFNVGLDWGFFSDRLSGTIDLYNRKTTNLIWDYTVAVPPYPYSNMTANAGTIRNTGIELSVTAIPIQTKDFVWQTSANFSHNKNRLLSLSNDKFISIGYSDQGSTGEPIQTTTHRIQEGQPIGNFYGYKSIDIDDSGHWIIEGADGKPKPIADEEPEDKKILGNGVPKYYFNWNNTINFKGFDFRVTMRGAFDFQILNMPKLQYGTPVMLSRGNILRSAYDKVYGKVSLADDQELQYVSYFIEDGDYWKIDDLTIGYTFDRKKFHLNWINNLRIYGTASNLVTITGYSGIDPEVPISGLSPGCDNKWRYPAARTFTIGASLTF
jgi:TonB-linked SusC/RagA family outer membrane protein